MKQKFVFFTFSLLLFPVLASPDAEFLIRAVGCSFPDANLCERVAIITVVGNRISSPGYPDTAAGVIYSNDAGCFFQDADRKIGNFSFKSDYEYRMTRTAYEMAKSGAVPAGEAISFYKITDEKKFDFLFDDSREDKAERNMKDFDLAIKNYAFVCK